MYLLHAISSIEQCIDGTHKLEEPVSNTTLNGCPGVPIVMGP